jgi:peroxiredoxin
VLHDIRVPKPAGTAEVAPLDLGVIQVKSEEEATKPVPAKATGDAEPLPSAAATNSDGRIYGTVSFEGQPVPHASILLQGTGINGPGATDANGRTFFYPTTNLQRVVFWHDEGGAVVDARNLTNEFRVELEKFGLVQGILRHHSEPWAGQIVALTPLATEFPFELRQSVRPVKTDAEGRFTFPGVPPGTWRVGYYPVSSNQTLNDPLGRPVGRVLTREETRHLDRGLAQVAGWPVGGPGLIAAAELVTVKSGQPAATEFDVSGRTLVGRAVADDPGRKFVWRGTNSTYNLRTPMPAEPTAPFRTEAERVAWFQRYADASANMRGYPVAMAQDGTFSVADVPPGDYELVFEITGEPAAGPAPNGDHTIAHYIHGISVPAAPPGAAELPVDLGTLTVPLDRGLRIGDTALAWDGKTLDGQTLRLSDFAGKAVLLVFWSMNGYSVPEIRTEPLKLQSLLDQYGTNLMRVVGMTLASESDDIQAFVEEHKLRWPQVSFDNLTASRVWQAYDVQAGPVLILVGADGKVRARHWTLEGIRPAVEEALHGLAQGQR